MPATATYGPTAAAQPQLGYGQRNEASLDAFNQWFRARPEYYAKLKEFGQDPTNVHLNDAQKQQMVKLAQSLGAVVDEGGNGQEVDDSGNFRAKGHKLRNTLIVAGIAAAALATAGAAGAFAGPAAGGAAAGESAAAGGGLLASTATVPTVGGLVAGGTGLTAGAGTAAGVGATAAGAGAVLPAATYGAGGAVTNFAASPAIAGTGATYGAAAGGGLASNLLKYGVPVVGGIVGDIIQAKAAGSAADKQDALLREALDYEKQQDALNRTIAADKVKLEAGRYADYSGNIAPYLKSGGAANSQMTSLLGLPAGAPSARGSSAPAGNPLDYADKLSAADRAKVDALLKASNSSDDPNYWYGVNAMHGGFDATGADWNQQRISTGDGVGKGYAGVAAPAPAPAQQTTQPQARTSIDPAAAQTVSIKAPDGSVRQVPASQKAHWLSVGGTEVAA